MYLIIWMFYFIFFFFFFFFFFLRSLLSFNKANEELIYEVVDKLSEYNSYCDPYPYNESLHGKANI